MTSSNPQADAFLKLMEPILPGPEGTTGRPTSSRLKAVSLIPGNPTKLVLLVELDQWQGDDLRTHLKELVVHAVIENATTRQGGGRVVHTDVATFEITVGDPVHFK